MKIVKIPRRFFDDHRDRELPTPPATRRGGQYEIDLDHPDTQELLDDARFYADPYGPDSAPNIKRAAKALLKAVGGRK